MNASLAMHAMDVDGVAIRRGGRLIVKSASFAIAAGDALILRGANGAGKTTLLRAVGGLLEPAAGTIRNRATGAAMDRRDRLGRCVYCGHADGVKAALTGRDHLRFWSRLYDRAGDAWREAAAAFDIEALLDRRAGQLSAGQRRRLGLARLVLSKKPLWLLDEPTASIDAKSAARLKSVVEAHCAAGGAIILATHDDFSVTGARALEMTVADGAA